MALDRTESSERYVHAEWGKEEKMKTEKYEGNWQTTNCNTYNDLTKPYKFTSLRTARKTMREMAKGNDQGTGATWTVTLANDGLVVASGKV